MGSTALAPADFTPELLLEFADVLFFNVCIPLIVALVAINTIKAVAFYRAYRRLKLARQRQARFDADLHLAWEEEKIAVREYLEQQLRETHQAQERG